ncbi:MAG: sugar phosphate nucleotidyltransferase [archaeon]|jgi:NDP-sugar pyrophosphorylase family protein
MTTKNITLVYPVAGLSSRFGGKVKQFAPVGPNGETLIEVSLNQALKSNFKKIVFIVGEKTENLFKEKFGSSYKGIPIFYAKQSFNPSERDKPWGTCEAILCAKSLINEPFVFCNGDDLYGENTFRIITDWVNKTNSPAAVGFDLNACVPENGSVNRAIFSVNKENYVTELVETIGIDRSKLKELNPTNKSLCSMNIFALLPSTLDLLETKMNEFKNKHKGDRKSECYLPVELSNLIKENKIKLKLLYTSDKWLGVTNPEDEEGVRKELALIP